MMAHILAVYDKGQTYKVPALLKRSELITALVNMTTDKNLFTNSR